MRTKINNNGLFRHGDVLLKPINSLPKNLKLSKDKVLAFGTVTGHSHRFKESKVIIYVDSNNNRFVKQSLNVAHLVHDEHDTIIIPRGLYQVIIQREFDLIDDVRKVMD